jgi:hypothetical protein
MSLIPLSYLNEACFLSLNENDKKYNMCLEEAEEDLKDVLGVEFYDQIVSQYPSTLSADNNALYNPYIKKFLAWQTYYIYLKFANVNATPTGIRSFDDDNSTLASDIQMFSLEKNVKARADKYRFAIINFLKESQVNDEDKYPLWEEDCKELPSFYITSVDKKSDSMIKISRTAKSNE